VDEVAERAEGGDGETKHQACSNHGDGFAEHAGPDVVMDECFYAPVTVHRQGKGQNRLHGGGWHGNGGRDHPKERQGQHPLRRPHPHVVALGGTAQRRALRGRELLQQLAWSIGLERGCLVVLQLGDGKRLAECWGGVVGAGTGCAQALPGYSSE